MNVARKAQRGIAWAIRSGLAIAAVLAALPVTGQEVVLRPGDAVRLELRDEPDLTEEYPVGPSGDVMFPLVGPVRVAGRPFEEVRAQLREAYARELARPDFLATPLMRVTVTGEVAEPGLVMAEPTLTLADLVAMAGGALPTAKRDRVDLLRDGERRELDFSTGSSALLMPPQSGDALHVPRRSWVSENLNILVSALATVAAATVTTLIVTSGN